MQLTPEEQTEMIKLILELSPGQGRKSYKMTRRMYDELRGIRNGKEV